MCPSTGPKRGAFFTASKMEHKGDHHLLIYPGRTICEKSGPSLARHLQHAKPFIYRPFGNDAKLTILKQAVYQQASHPAYPRSSADAGGSKKCLVTFCPATIIGCSIQ